ncbi:hypothetical protein ABNG02_01025 [Halorubrum ejinorense]|uniref:GtrA-like protein domain-containing protein n=1 Tax=Halorubrum ejinorense TaxID=425309 RepID=A0AAV3SPB3_9EURY
MSLRRNLYTAAFIGGSLSYIFNVLAFTGAFDVFRWFVFAAAFLGFTYAFEQFIGWQTDSA